MSEPKHATCETDSEGDAAAGRTPTKSGAAARKKSQSGAVPSPDSQRQRAESVTQKHRSSDSGYSTGTKGSFSTGHSQAAGMPPTERDPVSPTSARRPTMEQRAPSSRSDASQQSSRSARGLGRTLSTQSRSAGSDSRSHLMGAAEIVENGRQRRESETARIQAELAASRISSPSSRAPRAPSRASQEMPPPPRPRSRSVSTARARPNSFHAGMGNPYYPNVHGAFPREYGPPPAPSAYRERPAYGWPVRPPLSVLPPTPSVYHEHAALQRQQAAYEVSRAHAAHRAQTEFTPVSAGPASYSTRRPMTYFPDQPSPLDVRPTEPVTYPTHSRTHSERISPSARRPAYPPPSSGHLFDPAYDESEVDPYEDDEYTYETGARYIPTQTRQQEFNAHMSARGMPSSYGSYGTSPQHTRADPYLDDGFASASDYRSSVRSRDTDRSGSSRSRLPSVASSGIGTKATSYSASSGSGGYASQRRMSGYDQYQTVEAEQYMRNRDQQAHYVRHQQPPELTQESLRQQHARAVEAKRSSRDPASRVGGSVRSRTINAGDEQTVKVVIDTAAGMNLQLEGDTEGRPIRLVQKPGETKAELIIGVDSRRADTAAYGSSGSSARTNGATSKVTARSGATGAAVSGRRER